MDDKLSSLQTEIDYQSLLNQGLEKEAQIRKGISILENKLGRSLTKEEESEISEKTGKIFDLKTEGGVKDKEEKSIIVSLPSANALERIGANFGGSAGNRKQDQMINELKSINRAVSNKNFAEGVLE